MLLKSPTLLYSCKPCFLGLLPKHACKQHLPVPCNTAQVCCTAPAPLLCLSITAHAAQVTNSAVQLQALFPWLASKACMQAAPASALQYSTSVLHSTSTTALLEHYRSCCSSHQLCCTAASLVSLACFQSMHASSTCQCLAIQRKCVAQHQHHCFA